MEVTDTVYIARFVVKSVLVRTVMTSLVSLKNILASYSNRVSPTTHRFLRASLDPFTRRIL
jgi:hypothetical protein